MAHVIEDIKSLFCYACLQEDQNAQTKSVEVGLMIDKQNIDKKYINP